MVRGLDYRVYAVAKMTTSCSRWNPKDPSTASHYILRNLHGFDLEYLQALFASKTEDIKKREEEAKKYGYGLLAPCQYVGEHRQTREFCSKYTSLSPL